MAKKISEKVKGMLPVFGEYDDEPFELPEYDPIEDELAWDEETKYALEHNKATAEEWEKNGEENLMILRKNWLNASVTINHINNIGERIRFLRELNKQSLADIYESAKVSKSSLIRYESGETIPTVEKLKRIINTLFVSVADFSCYPDDIEKWKASFIDDGRSNDIFEYLKKVKNTLSVGDFTYHSNGANIRLPYQYLQILRDMADTADKVINTIPHDTK